MSSLWSVGCCLCRVSVVWAIAANWKMQSVWATRYQKERTRSALSRSSFRCLINLVSIFDDDDERHLRRRLERVAGASGSEELIIPWLHEGDIFVRHGVAITDADRQDEERYHGVNHCAAILQQRKYGFLNKRLESFQTTKFSRIAPHTMQNLNTICNLIEPRYAKM